MSNKIGVLLGGTSAERNVSLSTGKGVARALKDAGHDVRLFDPARGSGAEIDWDQIESIPTSAPTPDELASYSGDEVIAAIMALPSDLDVVFIALHGTPGEDGTIQHLLELREIPFTGSDGLASAIAMDKQMTKRLLRTVDIETPRWFALDSAEKPSRTLLQERVDAEVGYPVVVKTNDGGSTVGLSIVDEGGDLLSAFETAAEYSGRILFEEFIEGREVTVGVLEGSPLPIVEIRPHEGIYDYSNKYTPGRTEYHCPAELEPAVEEELKTLAVRAYEIVGCRDYARVDFRLDSHGVGWCLEINTLPGMTGTSLVPKAAAAAGIDYGSLCDRIVASALGRAERKRGVANIPAD